MAKSLGDLLNDPGSPVFSDLPRWTQDVDTMPSGMFTVTNSAKMPTTGDYCVISASGRAANNSRAAVQIALSSGGTASIRYFTGTWGAWAGLGASTYAHAPYFDGAMTTDPNLAAYATALSANPPTTFQQAIDVTVYYAAAFISNHNAQLLYLPLGGVGLATNLDHLVNPQTIAITGYQVGLITDGIGAFAHNCQLPGNKDLLQRVELEPQFNHAGETIVLKTNLIKWDDTALTTVTIANAANQFLLLEWVQRLGKWRLLDYTLGSITLA